MPNTATADSAAADITMLFLFDSFSSSLSFSSNYSNQPLMNDLNDFI